MKGSKPVTATSLAEAREHLESAPDIALLDLILPDGNAMELFSDLRAQDDADIVLLTAHASIETSIEALRLGATDYVLKPINMAYLRGLLSRVSRTSEAGRTGVPKAAPCAKPRASADSSAARRPCRSCMTRSPGSRRPAQRC